jgi:predicted nucleic acid-binding protein
MLYLDTSALLKLYIRETGSEAVQSAVEAQDDPLPVWEIQEMELINALHLKVFWGDITAKQAAVQVELFHRRKLSGLYWQPEIRRGELMGVFRSLCKETPRLGCRTLDILHVACAVHLAVTSFLTFDERQRKLAVRAGLKVVDPGR